MFVNILILIVLIALVVLFAWLTVRAVRAKRLWIKIAGGIGAGLLTLMFIAVAFMGAKGVAAAYFPGVPAAPTLTAAGTPEQIARGEYLVNLSCIGCHSAVGSDGAPSQQQPLSGGTDMTAAEGFGFIGAMVAENLTPGGKLAGYSDGELFRALRHSVNQQGHSLGFMSFLPYAQLSDQDTEAIIAYLRSLPPAQTDGDTGDKLNFVGALMLGAGMFGPQPDRSPGVVTAPAEAATAEYGKYVATYGDCRGCHGPNMTGMPATSVGPAVPNPRPFVAGWTLDQFTQVMRTGRRPDGSELAVGMPWQNASRMTDEDLAALYAYLKANP